MVDFLFLKKKAETYFKNKAYLKNLFFQQLLPHKNMKQIFVNSKQEVLKSSLSPTRKE